MLSNLQPQDSAASASTDSLAEYAALKRRLYITTLAIAGVVFTTVAIAYPINIALSYLLGMAGGLLYFRLLARSVDRIGPGQGNPSSLARLGVFVAVMLIAAKLETLEFIPTFLGFLTFKAAILLDTLRTLFE
ncbi:MAG: ATP synthase subunit I [Gemmatimonadaceae bacterium]|nr:ATP synthase subunit I [Gloeobacterales cyanobacterium ES-bin-141]